MLVAPKILKIAPTAIVFSTALLLSIAVLAFSSGAKVYAAPATKSNPADTKAKANCNSNQTPTPITVHGKKKWYCKDNSSPSGQLPQCADTQNPGSCVQDQGGTSNDPAQAKTTCDQNGCDLITTYLLPLINALSAAVGIVVVISIVYGGIQYSASGGDPQKAAMAKRRITNAIFALVIYLFFFAFMQWIIPGGFLH